MSSSTNLTVLGAVDASDTIGDCDCESNGLDRDGVNGLVDVSECNSDFDFDSGRALRPVVEDKVRTVIFVATRRAKPEEDRYRRRISAAGSPRRDCGA